MKINQVKSKERVKKYGEVYTRMQEVNAMLDLLPDIAIDLSIKRGIEAMSINCGQTVRETIVSKNIDFFIRKKNCV